MNLTLLKNLNEVAGCKQAKLIVYSSVGDIALVPDKDDSGDIILLKDIENVPKKCVLKSPYNGRPNAIMFSPNGQILASRGLRTLERWNFTEKDVGYAYYMCHRFANPILQMAFTHDGRFIAVSIENEKCLYFLNIATLGVAFSIKLFDSPTLISFHPFGRYVALNQPTLKPFIIMDYHSKNCVHTDSHHTTVVHSLQFSKDGNYLLSATPFTAQLWGVGRLPENILKKVPISNTEVANAASGSIQTAYLTDFNDVVYNTDKFFVTSKVIANPKECVLPGIYALHNDRLINSALELYKIETDMSKTAKLYELMQKCQHIKGACPYSFGNFDETLLTIIQPCSREDWDNLLYKLVETEAEREKEEEKAIKEAEEKRKKEKEEADEKAKKEELERQRQAEEKAKKEELERQRQAEEKAKKEELERKKEELERQRQAELAKKEADAPVRLYPLPASSQPLIQPAGWVAHVPDHVTVRKDEWNSLISALHNSNTSLGLDKLLK